MSFLDTFEMLGMNIWLYGIVFVLMLSVLVFVHEWGHYIVARIFGVRVEVFSIGFGREVFGFNDGHGTRWKFSLIPMGGYVKLYGDTDPASTQHSDQVTDPVSGAHRHMTEEERGLAFFTKPVWQRALIVLAGPAINYVFAIILMGILFMTSGQPVTTPLAAAIIADSSADKAGFLPHDKILTIDGKEILSFEDIRREIMISLDTPRNFRIEREGKVISISASPERMEIEDRFGFKHSQGLLGLISPMHALDIADIRRIDGQEFTADAGVEPVRAALKSRMNSVFAVHIQRGQEQEDLIIGPRLEDNQTLLSEPSSPEHNYLFIAPREHNEFVTFPPLQAFASAVHETWVVSAGTLEALWQMVSGTRSPSELGGVIRMGAMAGDMAQQGLVAIILFTALLSINLGLINLFPIPMLDGGHLMFYAFEAASGKPIPDQLQEYAFRFGLAFLVGLMVYANLNDIMHLIL